MFMCVISFFSFADVSHRVAEDKRIKAKRAEEEDLVELKKRYMYINAMNNDYI